MKRKSFSEQLKEAVRFIQENDRFLVISHVQPDGDAIGSTCAIGHLLQSMGKHFSLVNNGSVPPKFNVVPMSEDIVNYSVDGLIESYQAVITVDAADYERIGELSKVILEETALLNIDHHPTNDGYGNVTLIRDDAASTTEIIFEFVKELGIELSVPLATCLYTGLMTDTGGFRYSNTTPNVMRIASLLLESGVQGHLLAERLLETMSLPSVEVLRSALNTLQFSDNRKVAWVTVSQNEIRRIGAASDDLDGIVNLPRNIEGVEVGIQFKEIDESSVKVSFRSKDLDVAAIAQQFHGGGHVKAAGCTVQGTLGQVTEVVLHKVLEALK